MHKGSRNIIVTFSTSNMSSLAFIFFILDAPTAADRALLNCGINSYKMLKIIEN